MEYKKAIKGKNYMGLKNKICKNPRINKGDRYKC